MYLRSYTEKAGYLARYSTEDECLYLRNIGTTHANTLKMRGQGVAQTDRMLLTNYIAAAQKRSHWGEVDRDAVLAEARRLLAGLEATK